MPTASLRVSTFIQAGPEDVFAYVSDLTRHGEWSANPLKVEAVSAGAVAAGKQYRSTATVKGLQFEAKLRVVEYDPPARFTFEGEDSTGKFRHDFAFSAIEDGTQVTRTINFTLSFRQWLRYQILYLPVRRPAARKALALLKQKMEQKT